MFKTRLRPLSLFVLLSSLTVATQAGAKPTYPVMGYIPTYVGISLTTGVDWADLTQVMEAFGRPSAAGVISYPNGQRANLVATAHTNNTRVNLSLGGAGDSNANWRSAINSTNRANFIANIMTELINHGYDGIDIDWEFPNGGDQANFMLFMQDLSAAVRATNAYDGQPRGITFFISAGYAICGVDWATIGNYVDYGILSGYDMGCGIFNGSLDDTCTYTDCFPAPAKLSIMDLVQRLSGHGLSTSKMILGMPFYSSQNAPLSSILGGTMTQYYTTQAEATYGSNTGVNNAQSFCDKMNWAFSQSPPLAGIAMWELSQAPPSSVAVAAVWDVIGNRGGCFTAPPTNTRTATFTSTPTATPTLSPTPCLIAGTPCATDTPTFGPVSAPRVEPNPSDPAQPIVLLLPHTIPSDVKVRVFTVSFRKVWEGNFLSVSPGAPIPLVPDDRTGAPLANGFYYVVADTSQGRFTAKWLIRR